MIRSAFCLSFLTLLPMSAGAQAEPAVGPEIVGVRVGLAGRYKAGVWTPVEVTLRGGSQPMAGQVILTVPDGDGVPSRISTPMEHPVEVRPGEETGVNLFARFGRIRSELGVEFHGADRVVRRLFEADESGDNPHFPPAILSSQDLIVAVGPDAMGVQEAAGLLGRKAEERAVVVRLGGCQQLPDRWYGYEGVKAVVLSTSRPETCRNLTTDPALVEALDEWVQMGGRLVICVGERAETILQPDAPLARFTPGKLEKMVSLRQTVALEVYSGSPVPVPPMDGGKSELRVPLLADIEGTVEAWESNLPLVVRRVYGFGQIVFVAVDLDCPPFRGWEDRGRLMGRLLNNPATASGEVDENTALMHYGFTDIAGQLRSALDQFAGVHIVPFSIVLGLIILYVLAIGPGDYLLLCKIVRRRQLTWITFPLIVLVIGLGAYLLAYWFKGNQVRVNQVNLVDVLVEKDIQSGRPRGRLRGTAWANVFSPRTDRYNLSFQPRLPGGELAHQASVLTAWLGLPGDALGGMNSKTTDPVVWKGHYDFSQQLDALLGVPIQIWSTKSLTARWTLRTDDYKDQGKFRPEADLVEKDQVPNGTITNTLDFPLSECLFAYGRWAYPLGTIKPGESKRVGPTPDRRELKSLLTGRKMTFDRGEERFRQQARPYDRGSVDVPNTLRAMTFFEAVDGRSYTGLSNRYQGFVDLSDLLHMNRAVLLALAPAETGKARPHGGQLLRDGQPMTGPQVRCTTIYRFVFPVRRVDSP